VNLTAGQIAYLTQQRLGRLATVRPDGQPQVNPVACYYNPGTGTIDIGGHNMAQSRNASLHPLAAVVFDDMQGPNGIRCLEIRGRAEGIAQPADSAARTPGAIVRISPHRIISWDLTDNPAPPLTGGSIPGVPRQIRRTRHYRRTPRGAESARGPGDRSPARSRLAAPVCLRCARAIAARNAAASSCRLRWACRGCLR
jgi:pyridoxamine 5'-phosphate oxidase family protein